MEAGIDYPGVSVVFFCHDGQGNFLMQKRGRNCRDEHGTWDIGSGRIELYAGTIGTLIKEISEEYSTLVLKHEFLGCRDIYRYHENKQTHWIGLDFKVLVDKSRVKNGEPHKFDEIGWFNLDNLPSPLHSQVLYFLEKYQNVLK